MKNSDYQFSEPESTSCMVCSHVLEENAPILYVAHIESDGMWQFHCDATRHDDEHERMVAMATATAIDPGVNDLNDMPLGMAASRASTGDRWKPFKL